MNKKSGIETLPNYVFAGFWLRFFAFLIDLISMGDDANTN